MVVQRRDGTRRLRDHDDDDDDDERAAMHAIRRISNDDNTC